jgi:hypothetical protein
MDDNERAIRSIRGKLSDSRVRVDTIVRECERLDKNADGRIHADDLEDVIHDLLGPSTLNRREINMLTRSVEVQSRNGRSVEYRGLSDVLEATTTSNGGRPAMRDSTNDRRGGDRWDEDTAAATGGGGSGRSVRKTGSVGEWLHGVSCPAEQRNFRKFIDAMEAYERSSGMRVTPNEKGFLVPIGPDLSAQVNFFQS